MQRPSTHTEVQRMMSLTLVYLFGLPALANTLGIPLLLANLYMAAVAALGLTVLDGWRNT
ncbi:PfWMP4_21 [Phormidium phage Pf-WMP4]|uniref:PfWMP4_21 n=1 Tax=Phormidium phage Pf-WMP4 TaxID=2913979 RepID=Q0GBU5_9CAUD|nr:PfWMP4_21 [Phormidium phage Pf-WMP4]ABI33165.1 PfWMP4_21 [Phormidium phage Pf-WMP4]